VNSTVLLPGAIQRAIELALTLMDRAWASDQGHNVYFEPIPGDQVVNLNDCARQASVRRFREDQ
jgi:hypothetical protein